jgi:hypothetical protein
MGDYGYSINLFVKNNKYEEIYATYKHYDMQKRFKGRVITFSIVSFPLALIFILGAIMLQNKK